MVSIDNFDPRDIVMRKITLDEYKATPYREEFLYTIVDDDEDECIQGIVVYTDDGPWHLSNDDASLIRNHVFSECWEKDRILDGIFYRDKIAAVRIYNNFILLSCDGYMCIYFTLGRMLESGNLPK